MTQQARTHPRRQALSSQGPHAHDAALSKAGLSLDRRGRERPSFRDQGTSAADLPQPFRDWFARRGWSLHAHQLALLEQARRRRSTLLIAPTGAGKTLAGFLPSLVALAARSRTKGGARLHTLYVSPLKALAADVARNLMSPIADMGLAIRCETRTGDTSQARRQRQRARPPDILLATPEQAALMLSHPDAVHLFAGLDTLILDELHALAATKRGDLLALDVARLNTLAPGLMTVGLSATVAHPSELRAYLKPQRAPDERIELADLVVAEGGAKPKIGILELEVPVPWAGHSARYAIPEIHRAIAAHRLSLVFVNTRMQAELVFQELWRVNDAGLAIALHHGSLDRSQRAKVEAAMAAGRLKAVVATSTLDLGIDWGDVDLVINVGAPKGASRLIQRIGRANHRLDEASEAILVPANRFEVLECRAALEAAEAGEQDAALRRTGALDVLAQHVLGMACQAPFDPEALYAEVRSASPYAGLQRRSFDRVVDFVATGGYALRAYERFARLKPAGGGRLRIAHPRLAQQYRLNAGTIVEAPMITIRLIGRKSRGGAGTVSALTGGRILGQVEEAFIEQLTPGATFVFAGEVLRFEGLREMEAFVSRAAAEDPMIPSYDGGKFPLSTHLARRVRAMLAEPCRWQGLPGPVAEWLGLQAERSLIPAADEVLIETFPRGARHFLVAYPFEGRLAHQTLGMLLTRRLDRAGARPLGFVANDYGLAVWSVSDLSHMIAAGWIALEHLLGEDMLGDDLDAWLVESSLMKRTFRLAAVIAGLIERRHPGREKSGRQITVSTDLVYDVLRKHDPGHILLEAAWADAATGLLDIARLGDFLRRIRGRIRHQPLPGVSPLSVPILLEIGRETVAHVAREDVLRDAAEDLIAEAAGKRRSNGGGDARAQAGASRRR
ncbi:MAG TPA: ligase-associated DNA damage response DEXH box helicase [Hyphomicrobiaceae bacterium]|nr:ligase-associated DNA damage response DEXH box helicase [Hyphomicrobiaceae bacterium]